jgi:hypothetical protein
MKARAGLLLFILACLFASGASRRAAEEPAAVGGAGFPGWPAEFEGKPLRETALNAVEQAFSGQFPGRMGRFTDGSRLIVMRWVTAPTHRVHSGADCLQAAGYRLKPGDWRRDPQGAIWSTWTAAGKNGALAIRERCFDDHGRSWQDVSSWFWAAVTGRSAGPWWVVTVAEREAGSAF